MGVFNLEHYVSGSRTSLIRFTERPDHSKIIELICRYFGGGHDGVATSVSNSHHQWKFTLLGNPDSKIHKQRFIEVYLDLDTQCGRREEPYYFVVRN